MNPELPQVRTTAEMAPQTPSAAEYHPESAGQSPELGLSDAEHSAAAQAATVVQVATAVVPTIPQLAPLPAGSDFTSVTTSAPSIAADEDLIEKEWVDKVKSIIILTKDDPYERARVIAQLQADYLKKRYQKDLGRTGE